MKKLVEIFARIKQSLFGIRKFSIMILLTAIGVTFRLTEHINGAEMVELLKVTGAAFFASNMVSKISEAIKERLK